MTANRYSAWRFGHPDLDKGTGRVGLTLTPRRTVAMVDGDDSVRQSVLLLLSTRPGERVMRPDYGCNLHQLIFSPNDDTTAALAIHYIRRALERWEPRIDIISIDAGAHADAPNHLHILLEYQVRTTQLVEQLALDFALDGEAY